MTTSYTPRQQFAIGLEEMWAEPSVPIEPPHAAAGSQIDDQEPAVGQHGNAVGQEARRCAEDCAPRLAELDDAGGVIAGKDLAPGRGQHAFAAPASGRPRPS